MVRGPAWLSGAASLSYSFTADAIIRIIPPTSQTDTALARQVEQKANLER